MKEERGRKKYTQKQPPDKTQKKNRPKYVAKDSIQEPPKAEEKPQPKQQKTGNYKPKKQYYEKPQFVERISSQTEDKMMCLICSEGIRKKEPIWTCRQCFISLHLRCIKQWIHQKNQQRDRKSKFIYHWDCVQCKHQYHEEMPKYYCFCGRYQNPQIQRDLQPHSCGRICERKRGPYCPHHCPELCHSGKCKPCEFQGSAVTCHCGKSERVVKCSEEREPFMCGKKCDKQLNCGKHKCGRNCHSGPCYPCKKKHMAKCFCKKNEDIIDCAESSYSCLEECGKTLNCEFHKCQELCHQGQCKKCLKTPQLQTHCPCGRFSLMMLSINERESCRDPIPVCGTPCKKKLNCGHQCNFSCHEGKCSECKVMVKENCNCGSKNRKIECYKIKSTKEEFKCDLICKRKKNCGFHVCNTQCCKFRNSPFPEDHKCENTCQKMLNCEKHTCGENCHMGACKKCPVIYSQPQPCPCGSTSIKPPVFCGTITPECDNPCNKQLQCGHKCQELCHYGRCRCYENTMVKCRCGKEKIQTTCGREALCLTKCQNILKCGHKCLIQCHSQPCEELTKVCHKKCDKTRKDCEHKCKQICHFGKQCQTYPCQAQIMIKCQCGHRRTSILCGNFENTPGKKKQIACNKKCENLKRFDILYKDKEIYYPNSMMQFGFKNFKYLERLEERLSKFILESDEHFIQVQFKFMGNNQARIVLHNLFENHYHLNTHFYRLMKSASFTLMQTEDTMIPKPCLSEYIKQVAKGFIKRTNLPFQYTVRFDGENQQKIQQITKLLKPYLHSYYIERKDKMVLVHFWNKDDGIQAKSTLENQYTSIDFYGEENFILEQQEQEIDMDQIIDQQIVEEQKTLEKKQEEPKQLKKENQQEKPEDKQEVKQERKENTEEQMKQKVEIESEKKQEKEINEEKPKIIKVVKETPKIIIKKSAPNFNRSQYPPSSENVQDIYAIDQDELYQEKIDWDKLVSDLRSKKMGIEASQWRIRCLVMISSFHTIPQNIFRDEFIRIFEMYEKDKEKTKRILEIQKIDVKKVKEEMKYNQLYLSDHEPEIVSYALLQNYFAFDKIEMEVSNECSETRQVQRAVSIIESVEQCELSEFYEEVYPSDYILNCILIPFVHEIREVFLKTIEKKRKYKAENTFKHLFFSSEQEMLEYGKANNIIIEKKYSKSQKENMLFYVSGETPKQFVRDNKFVKDIELKRDKKYFLNEPEELVDDKWATRSFFAFGDFKQSINPKYMLALSRSLKEN